ncbi:MAG: CRTAC1 family protein [Solirubrobacterales bacterium]
MGARTWHRRGLTAALAAVAALAVGAVSAEPRISPFTTSEAPLPNRIYDLGVAYVDDDSDPDIFTSAHNNRQIVAIGDGSGGFDDRISDLDLDHVPAFPGLEAINNAPPLSAPGLYVFYRPEGLRLLAHDVNASGTLLSRGFRKVEEAGGANGSLRRLGGGDLPRSQVDFTAPPGGQIDVRMTPLSLPVRLRLGGNEVFVGSQAVPTDKGSFAIQVRDRHGMGWADADSDGDTDVFIVRGGLAGRIKGHANLVQDQLMRNVGARFEDVTASSGVRKGRCRARVSAPLDVDGDGRTDLSASCVGGPTRLFLRRGSEYVNASGALKRAGARGAAIEWADIRGGATPELLTFDDGGLRLFERRADGSWARRQRLLGLPRGEMRSAATADIDRDGDADVMVSARDGLTLLRNRRGRLTAEPAATLGLPPVVDGPIAWIDHQNDGRLDLFAPPGGIYQGTAGGFTPTGILATGPVNQGRTVWMDVEGDGDRDGILTGRSGGDRVRSLYRNNLLLHHWLEVDVEGRGGARDAPGARVRVKSAGVVQTAWVGQSDSSRFSAGDARLYFGLADATSVDRLTVEWTDGARRTLRNVPDNQLLRVERP